MPYDYKAKAKNVIIQNNYMLAKTVSMFEWENLPETIPYKELEKLLQVNGFAFITKVNGELYAFNGGLGGVPDVYGSPTQITISNPALNFNETLDIKKDGVLIVNDDFQLGLIPLFDRYNTFLIENDINMMIYGYNSRTQKLISASDDKTKTSAEAVVKKSIEGDIAVIGESFMFEGIKVHSGANNSGVSITNLTEFHQYIKASLYNEIGLSANFNMKRERLTAGEIEVGDDSNYPFVYNMLKCRIKAVEAINKMFNLDINVDFGSVWAKSSKEVIDDVIDEGQKPDELETMDANINADSGNSETEKSGQGEMEELKQIINDPDSSEEDKQTAQELIDELEQNSND